MKRGRKSSSELASIAIATMAAPAPDAPYDLSDEAAEIWRTIVATLPADFVPREMHDVLAAHCRHVATGRFISREIDRFTFDWLKVDGGIDRLAKLTAIRDREVRGALATARALRLTSQSRYRPERAATARQALASGLEKPWEPRE
ncbi:hypothetical protein SAMN03159463_05306 [Mesorhizobium sp. NFR06]|nr:hypothetical protein SAMN03159463_05306 [Mesorhizobium sp. NFR06]